MGDQVGHQRRQAIIPALSPAEGDVRVLTLDKPCFAQTSTERRN
jgi:hypothetical protein